MTEQQHPITPPPELVGEWLCSEDYFLDASTFSSMTITSSRLQNVATRAARWGADQELEACVEWLKAKGWSHPEFSDELRTARRPEPQSLKEQALVALSAIALGANDIREFYQDIETIKSALETLPNN